MKNRRQRDDSREQQYRVQFEKEALPHLDAVYSFACSLTGNRVFAEDLTQEAFLHAFRGYRKFQTGSNCKAWLFKICKNLFIDQFRRRARVPQQAQIETR